jgi:hypothetical protein
MHYSISANAKSNPDLSAQIDAIFNDTALNSLERWICLAGLAVQDARIAPILRQNLYRELRRPADQQAVLKALANAERRRTGPLAEMMRNIVAYRSGISEIGVPENANSPQLTTTEQVYIRLDPEIGRMAIGLSLAAQHRIWSAIRQYAGSRSYVDIDELQQLLAEQFDLHHGVNYLRKLLRKGNGIFWGLTRDKQRIFYRGAARVGVALIQLARSQGLEQLYETNLPGGRDVWVPVQANLQSWKAYVYAAWFAWRDNPAIARSTLCGLFGVSKETLYNWDALLPADVLHTRRNEAQSACCDTAQLPDHATQYMTWSKETRYRWQLSNTFVSSLIVHASKGQARRVRELAWHEAYGQPVKAHQAQADPSACWFDRSHRTLRHYHTSLGRVQHYVKLESRIEARNGNPRGFRKQQMYLWRGMNAQGRGIYEYIPLERPYGEIQEAWQPQTKADERVPLKVEYRRDWLGSYKRSEREYLRFRQAQGELA